MVMRRFAPMAVIAALVLLSAPDSRAWADSASAQAAKLQPSPAAAASVVDAVIAEVQAQVPISGTLVAEKQVQVYPQVSGFEIVEITVDSGDEVEKGQLLARLSDSALRAQLEQAKAEYQRAEAGLSQAQSQVGSAEASLAQASAALDRAKKLRDSGNTSQAALDQAVSAEAGARATLASNAGGVALAEAQMAQAAAARDVAQLDLDHTRILAPVAGVISDRNAELGALAGAAQEPLFVLVSDGRIELAGEVIETALGLLEVGQPATIAVAGAGKVKGEVRRVPASVDATTRLGIVRVALEDSSDLRVGLFASGWITTIRRDAVTVPATAVLAQDDDTEIVQVVQDGRIETRKVKAGLLWQGRREILEGIEAGETVIARSGAFFRNGDPVDPVYPEERTGQEDEASEAADDLPSESGAQP